MYQTRGLSQGDMRSIRSRIQAPGILNDLCPSSSLPRLSDRKSCHPATIHHCFQQGDRSDRRRDSRKLLGVLALVLNGCGGSAEVPSCTVVLIVVSVSTAGRTGPVPLKTTYVRPNLSRRREVMVRTFLPPSPSMTAVLWSPRDSSRC